MSITPTVVEIPGLDRIPVLQYLKEPAIFKEDLYIRYPDGGEYGWFAFVYSLKSLCTGHLTNVWGLQNLGTENVTWFASWIYRRAICHGSDDTQR